MAGRLEEARGRAGKESSFEKLKRQFEEVDVSQGVGNGRETGAEIAGWENGQEGERT